MYLGFELIRLIASYRKLHQIRFRLRSHRMFINISTFMFVQKGQKERETQISCNNWLYIESHNVYDQYIYVIGIQSNGTDEHRTHTWSVCMVHTSNKWLKGEKQQAQVFCFFVFFFSLPFINGTHKYWSHHASKHLDILCFFIIQKCFFLYIQFTILLSVDNCWKPVHTFLFIVWLFFILGLRFDCFFFLFYFFQFTGLKW